MDVLTIEQLENQLERQEAQLQQMKDTGKEAEVIDAFEKFVLLTKRRLERAKGTE